MESEKQIEIKIEGNDCIINFPDESLKSKNKSNASLHGSLANFEDLTLTISKTSEDISNINNNDNTQSKQLQTNPNNSIQMINLINNTNEKSKLEITNMSIFYSEKKSDISSNIKTPTQENNNFQKNTKNLLGIDISNSNHDEKKLKDSVIRKLNFDSYEETDTIKKLPDIHKTNNFRESISKNLNERYFIYEKTDNKNSLTNNNISANNNNPSFNKENIANKKTKINACKSHDMIKVNKNLKYCKIKNDINTKENQAISKYFSPDNISIDLNNFDIKSKLIYKSKSNINHYNKYHIKNKNQVNNLKAYFGEITEIKNLHKSKLSKFKCTSTLSQIKKKVHENSNSSIKIGTKTEIEKDIQNHYLIHSKLNNTNLNNYINNNDNNIKSNTKLFPRLSPTNSFNTSNSKIKKSNINNSNPTSNSKNKKISSLKNSYHFKTPSASNNKGRVNPYSSSHNRTNCSSINTALFSSSSNKTGGTSRTEKNDILSRLCTAKSSIQKLIQSSLKKEKKSFLTNKKEEKCEFNKVLFAKAKKIKEGGEHNNIGYILKKYNTDLKNVLKNNSKKLNNNLKSDRNCLFDKNSFVEGNNAKFIKSGNKMKDIKEFKQLMQKNQFDKEMLKTMKKRGSFHQK